MAEITNFLNQPLHVFQVVNNAIAGGVVAINATAATNATGGLAVATIADGNGLLTITYNAFSAAPVFNAHAIASATANIINYILRPVVVGVSSAQLQAMSAPGSASANGAVSVGLTAHVFMYGSRTGTSIN